MLAPIEKMLDRAPDLDSVQAAMDEVPFMREYRNRIGLIALSLLLAFISLGVFYVLAKRISPPALFFISATGQATLISSMPLPNQSREAVKDWAREAIQKAYTIDFLNSDKALASAEPYFTQDAWPLFKSSVSKSPLVAEVKKNKLSVSVVAKTDPLIETAAADRGAEFAWKLIVPVTISFSGDATTKTQESVIRVTVVRVPTTENPKGLGVLQMVAGSVGGK